MRIGRAGLVRWGPVDESDRGAGVGSRLRVGLDTAVRSVPDAGVVDLGRALNAS